jgi:hypothetical protein
MAVCRKISFGRIFTFIAAYWMVADIVFDFITMRKWKNECDTSSENKNPENITIGPIRIENWGWQMDLFSPNSDISCKLWPFAAFFMVFPTIIMTFLLYCCGCFKGKSWKRLVFGPFYIISVPLYAIRTSTQSLFCPRPNRKEKQRKKEVFSDIKELESMKLSLDEKLKSESWNKEDENDYVRIRRELREKTFQIKRKHEQEKKT